MRVQFSICGCLTLSNAVMLLRATPKTIRVTAMLIMNELSSVIIIDIESFYVGVRQLMGLQIST